MITDQEISDAIDRIARSEDGRLLYLMLQKELCGIPGGDDCALREHHGRRRFAAELMGRMAKGIEQSAGSRSTDQPVTFAVAGARRVAATRGAGRRVTADHYVAGFDGPTDTGTE